MTQQTRFTPGNYVTRNGAKASVWEMREITQENAQHYPKLKAGDYYLIGTIQNVGINYWYSDGTSGSDCSKWDLMAPK